MSDRIKIEGKVQFLQGNVVNRFQKIDEIRLEFSPEGVDIGVLWNYAECNILINDPVEILSYNGEESISHRILHVIGNPAYYAEIEKGYVAGRRHENVAGMGIGMEKSVFEYLFEKGVDPYFCQSGP